MGAGGLDLLDVGYDAGTAPRAAAAVGGGVRLARGQGWLQAEQARIDIATGKVTATQVKGSIPVPPRGP